MHDSVYFVHCNDLIRRIWSVVGRLRSLVFFRGSHSNDGWAGGSGHSYETSWRQKLIHCLFHRICRLGIRRFDDSSIIAEYRFWRAPSFWGNLWQGGLSSFAASDKNDATAYFLQQGESYPKVERPRNANELLSTLSADNQS